jgi:hypothetical protein
MIIFIWILCGVLSAMVAGGKDHDAISWFFGGILFGPLALLATLGLGNRKTANQQAQLLEAAQRQLAILERRERRRSYDDYDDHYDD